MADTRIWLWMSLYAFVNMVAFFLTFPEVVSGGKPPLKRLHKFMNEDELKRLFGVLKHDDVPKYNVVNIRMRRSTSPEGSAEKRGGKSGPDEVLYLAETFGYQVELRLQRNVHLQAPGLRVVRTTEQGDEEETGGPESSCHYLGVNESISAALSNCGQTESSGMRGLLLTPDSAFNVQPLPHRLTEMLGPFLREEVRAGEQGVEEFAVPHVVSEQQRSKRLSLHDKGLWDDEVFFPEDRSDDYTIDDADLQTSKRAGKEKYLELAVFFDQEAYDKFMPYAESEENLRSMILGFVNQMQALFIQPSLKENIQISIVYLEIMKKQPGDMPHSEGERDKLLDAFCKYQEKKNKGTDSDPNHWDMALYISGLNFFAMENGEKNGITMGLAPVGGVCQSKHACVITEFGTVSDDGKPYPSAGFLSTYVAAHEIAHNLGMFHDGPPSNKCPSNGHVMSPSRGTKGETTWSTCSAEAVAKMDKGCLLDSPSSMPKDMDHSKFKNLPGQLWDAHDQCKVFLRDEDATLYNDSVTNMVCEQTLCQTPNRIGYYSAGPALDGTFCGEGKWCVAGKCSPWGSEKPKVVSGGWGDWKKGSCQSGCIKNSKGAQTDRRKCNNPKPQNTLKTCEGQFFRVNLCDDSKVCSNRVSLEDYAKKRCEEFAKYVPDVTEVGVQVKHNDERQWQACAVYCKMKSSTWYTPRQELNDLGVDTFFPDGTWCHNNGKQDFYCQNHLCLPSSAPQGRAIQGFEGVSRRNRPEIDVKLLNNARPKGGDVPHDKLREYFKYVEGKHPPPLPGPEELARPKEDDYEIIDYVSPAP